MCTLDVEETSSHLHQCEPLITRLISELVWLPWRYTVSQIRGHTPPPGAAFLGSSISLPYCALKGCPHSLLCFSRRLHNKQAIMPPHTASSRRPWKLHGMPRSVPAPPRPPPPPRGYAMGTVIAIFGCIRTIDPGRQACDNAYEVHSAWGVPMLAPSPS